ncbi:apolipoprotein D [Drosophila tropicalis]|uniref:apolipoprotein D n=1 Tax=Drosophila tropicalis TaxID=46794 RepID=UPI0035AB851D
MNRLTSVKIICYYITTVNQVMIGSRFLILILLFGQPSWALLAFEGSCPSNMTAIADLDMDRLLGRWYTYSMYPNLSHKVPICQSVDFVKIDDTIAVRSTQLNSNTGTLKISIDQIKHAEPALGKYEMVGGDNKAFPDGITMYVLDTDYENFIIRYLCFDSNNIINFQWAVIQTRHRLPSSNTIFKAQALARDSGILISKMVKVRQDACPPDT